MLLYLNLVEGGLKRFIICEQIWTAATTLAWPRLVFDKIISQQNTRAK